MITAKVVSSYLDRLLRLVPGKQIQTDDRDDKSGDFVKTYTFMEEKQTDGNQEDTNSNIGK